MPRATNAKYRKAAEIYHAKGCSQAQALLEAKVYAKMETARTKAHLVFRENEVFKEHLAKLQNKSFDAAVLAKAEKLEASAEISRLLADKIKDNLEGEDDIDNKAIDSFVKIGKRDDQLQGHSIAQETNPNDKQDATLIGWFLEFQEENDKKRLGHAEFIKDAIPIDEGE